ncbi:MAG: PA14 domain-containing protein [Phycisphaerae bacterium]
MFRKMKWFVAMLLVIGICTDAVLAELIGYWPFDEGQGTEAADITGNGNDGMLSGGVEWVPGYKDSAVRLDTAGDRVVINALDPTAENNAMTLAIWINWEGQDHGSITHQGIFGKRQGWDPRTNVKWFWEAQPDGDLQFRNGDTAVTASGVLDAYANEWIHVAMTWDNGAVVQYINAEQVSTGNITFRDTADATVMSIGCVSATNNETFVGSLDEARIYNRALTQAEIQTIMLGIFPTAFSPDPADGTIHEDTWVTLSWKPGTSAVTHDVYFGDNFDDVNAGAESTFQGNQAATFFVVGFPGFAFPDGLVHGTTYYWRIDEVNDLDPNSPWAGNVWSFTVPPKTAFNPVPADGAKFLEPDVELSWAAGLDTILHNVYFGDNFDDIDAGTGDTAKGPLGTLSFSPGTLESGKTYYWRIDEFDGIETHKGNIWSFTIAGTGGGVRADYYTGMNFENLVLTRTDPQINFNWGDPGGPDPAVGDDNFSVQWTGEVEAAFTETYTFYTNSDDGIRLLVDGQLLVENWTNHANTENKGTIDLVAGNTYSFVMEYYEDGGGAVAQLRWSSPHTPKQLIPQAALSLPVKASSPNPSNRAVGVSQTLILSWGAGEAAASHEVYFGTDADAVKNADTSSPEYKGSRNLGSESYDPGKLEWGATFYWRVDEIEGDGTIQRGNVWSFTVADFIVIDDFESYNDLDPADPESNRIFNAWIDGYDDPTNGSLVGYDNPPFAEQTIVHGGGQSMPFAYDNAVGKSEATLTLTDTRDWTQESVGVLSLWFQGDTSNAAEPMYVALNGSAAVTNDNPDAAQAASWTEWRIDLKEFADQGVNLANVDTIAIGLGNKKSPVAGGSGTIYIDDIRLYRPPEPEPTP